MLPYWNNSDVFTCGPDGVYCTGFQSKKQGTLLVVTNLNDTTCKASVKVNLKALKAKAEVTDAFTGDKVAFDNDTIAFDLEAWRCRAFVIAPK